MNQDAEGRRSQALCTLCPLLEWRMRFVERIDGLCAKRIGDGTDNRARPGIERIVMFPQMTGEGVPHGVTGVTDHDQRAVSEFVAGRKAESATNDQPTGFQGFAQALCEV